MVYGPVITLDIPAFRARFPAFMDTACFPDSAVDLQWVMASQFVSDCNYGDLNGSGRELGIQLMVAHLFALQDAINSGGQTGIVTSATIDKITVTLAQPPFGTDAWRWWLNTTPYGAQLLALLSASAVGGYYFGGLPERRAFRKVGGIF